MQRILITCDNMIPNEHPKLDKTRLKSAKKWLVPSTDNARAPNLGIENIQIYIYV